MITITLHTSTLAIPAILVLISIFLLRSGSKTQNKKLIRSGLILLIVNGLVTTFTSAMGGASLSMIKSVPGVDLKVASMHAWTGMAAFIVSLVIAAMAIARLRSGSMKRSGSVILLSIIFLALFGWTSLLAISIQS